MKTFPQWLPLQAAADRWLRRRQVLPAAQVKSNPPLSLLYPAHTNLAFNFLKLPLTVFLFFLIPHHNPPVELRHTILREYEEKYSLIRTWHNIEGNPNSLDLNLYCELLYSGYLLHCFSFLKMKNFQNIVLLQHPSPQLQIWTWELKTNRKIRSPRVCSGTWELWSWTWDFEVDLA